MKTYQKLITVLSILLVINLPLFAQQESFKAKPLPINKPVVEVPKLETKPVVETNNKQLFRSSLLKAATSAQKKGEINRRDLIKIRVALFSPAFLNKVEDLAVIQMSSSGEDGPFETSETGEIIRETINWEGLAAFLEKLMPLILALLAAFGA